MSPLAQQLIASLASGNGGGAAAMPVGGMDPSAAMMNLAINRARANQAIGGGIPSSILITPNQVSAPPPSLGLANIGQSLAGASNWVQGLFQ